MKGFVANIETLAEKNLDFRRVIYTGKHLQLVLMALAPGEDIGEEVHREHDQFFRVEEGKGELWIDGRKSEIQSDFAVVIPAGAKHNIRNTGSKPMKLYSLYGPPAHEDRTVHLTKSEALSATEHFAGHTTE